MITIVSVSAQKTGKQQPTSIEDEEWPIVEDHILPRCRTAQKEGWRGVSYFWGQPTLL